MAEQSVSYVDAKKVIEREMTEKEKYNYADLGDFLKKDFPRINANQISGIINKLGNNGVITSYKPEGSRKKYELKKIDVSEEKNKTNSRIHELVDSKIDQLINDLNSVPSSQLRNGKDLDYLKEKISDLKKLKESKD